MVLLSAQGLDVPAISRKTSLGVPVYDDGRYLGDFNALSLQQSLRALPTPEGERNG